MHDARPSVSIKLYRANVREFTQIYAAYATEDMQISIDKRRNLRVLCRNRHQHYRHDRHHNYSRHQHNHDHDGYHHHQHYYYYYTERFLYHENIQ